MEMQVPHTNFVILADDDQDHAFLFKLVLHKVNPATELVVAKDGKELLELLKKRKPQLLFLDLKMPCKNGLECLKEIRQNPLLHDLPIVVYSSSSKMSDIQSSYSNKANLYMVKPFHTDHLQHALESIFKMDLKTSTTSRNHYFINNRFVPFTAAAT